MLSPEYLLRVSEGAEEIAERLHQDIVKRLIQRIVARLERGDDYILTPIDKYQLETLKQAGFLMKDIEKEIAAKTKLQRAEIRAAFEDAGIRSYAYDSRVYEAAGLATKPLTQSPQYIRMMQRAYEATLGEWRNFSRTTAGEAYRRFIVECDRAYYSVQSGAISYTQAFREAINRIADEGVVVAYRDKDGNITRRDTIETATLRNIRTGISQSCAEITNARMEEMDWDILLVSAHLGARYTEKNDYTNHFWWQGKFYSKSGKDERFPPFSVCGQGDVQGINGANCRHSYSPGDGETNPFSDYDSEENKKAYDLSQKQRQLENRIRHTKRQVMAIKEGRDYAEHPDHKAALDEDYKKKSAKLERQNKEYKDFCEQNGLKTRQERLTIAKWDRQQAAEARGAAARYKNSRSTEPREKPDTSTVEISVGSPLTESSSGAKIEEVKRKEIIPISERAISDVPEVKISGYTDEQCKTIQEQHKELLRYARDNNDSSEVAFVFREGLTDRKIVVGTDTEIDLGRSTVGNGFNQFVMHNHPRGSSFSKMDIGEWAGHDEIRTMSIIKNNGCVEIITKNSSFDKTIAMIDFKRAMKKCNNDIDKAIAKFLSKGDGFEWIKKDR